MVVESDGGRWFPEQGLRDAGYDVAVCPGPRGRVAPCPLLVGQACPLVSGADLVVSTLRGDDGERLRTIHDQRRDAGSGSPARLSIDPASSAADAVDAVRGLLKRLTPV